MPLPKKTTKRPGSQGHAARFSGPTASTASTVSSSVSYGGTSQPRSRESRYGGMSTISSRDMMSTVSSIDEDDRDDFFDEDEDYFEMQLFAYRFIYVLQGVFMGLLGPSLNYFSEVALVNSQLTSPIASFGPIFAAHGGAALVMSFMSEIVLTVAVEKDLIKYLMVFILLCSSAWYACLPPLAAASGSLGVSLFFIAKGFWASLLNISLNRCCLWVAGEKIERGRSLVTSMNICYGFGTVLGPAIALLLTEVSLDMSFAFYSLAVATVIPMAIILVLPSPRPLHGRDEHQTLLVFEDPTRRVPTVPSPIVGGVFLHVKHIGGSANCNPDTYDPMTNLIILLVTIFTTLLFGIQLGLGAFLFDYIGHVVTEVTHPVFAADDVYSWCCLLMALFWGALWLSYCFFSTYMFHALNLFSIFHLSIVCMFSSFAILFATETGFAWFTVFLAIFAFALAPLFTLSIHCLTRVINELLIRRVSSLIVFGAGMGEVFIPVLMGFFMGDYSGQMYGSVAVSYITFILSIALVGVSGMLLMMVKKKLKVLTEGLDDLASNGGMALTDGRRGNRKHRNEF